MYSLSKRQIIILGAFALPVIGLIALSSSGSAPTPLARHGNHGPVSTPPTLIAEREKIKARMKEADAMTLTQYAVLQKNDHLLPPNMELFKARLRMRLDQLEAMTPEQWEAEQRQRADQMRQQGLRPPPQP